MAAGFKLVRDIHDTPAEEVTISSLAVAVGDVLELDAGAAAFTAGDASTQHWQRKGVALGSATTADTAVLVIPVNPDQVWEVESANNSNSAHNGDRMLLTDANTVNNTGSDNTSQEACVVQVGVVGATTDNRILVKFAGACNGVDPDAA